MKPFAFFAAAAVCAAACAAAAQPAPPPPYDDTPATYPWRNGLIDGPGAPGPCCGGGPVAPYGAGGYPPVQQASPPQSYAAGPYPGAGPVSPVVFPLPDDSGGYTVAQRPDGTLMVTRFGPVWTSQINRNGWAHRHYIHYGLPFSGLWPIN